jgi:ribosomal protein S14
MKNLPFKKASLFNDNKNRNLFSDNEIFFDSCLILNQSKFSNKLFYFLLKRRQHSAFFTTLKNRCILSGYSRSVISRAKLSRIALSRKILDGSMPGFYKSV